MKFLGYFTIAMASVVSSAVAADAAPCVVPAPQKMTVGEGFCANPEVTKKTAKDVRSEGYRLEVSKDGIVVEASDDAGFFYAEETLKQLRGADGKIPCCKIDDWPVYSWRGVHIDDCRHFFGRQTVKQVLDLMAMHKMNRLHWHLTEDQAWRLSIPGYPELVKYGAVRSASPSHGVWPTDPKRLKPTDLDGQKYGPFYYTEADVREIVAYAAERHVVIVPEIELPGHVYAALAAYPEFACRPENLAGREPRLVWGIEQDVLCLGNDKAIRFMEDVLDYVCRIFPGDVVHIGGDECPQVRWKECPKCRARIEKEGLGDEHGLQPWITRHFVKFLADRGKRTLGWDEYLLGDIPRSAIGMNWRESRSGAGHELVSGAAAALRGHDVVMTPCSYCYLDYGQGLRNDPFQYIGGKVTLERCYSFDPRAGLTGAAREHILGGQCNNWSEYTWNEYDLAWKMWPRTSALAEALWTAPAKRDYAEFLSRMAVHRERLLKLGVNAAPLPPVK